MFAGAAREAVFSQREVVRRVNRDFIPVALKAGLVNNPPSGIGETGVPLTGAAVANAIAALTGIRLRRLPMTPDRVLAAISHA